MKLMRELERIRERDFQIEPDGDVGEYIPAMTQWIGSPDPYLRDELIYSAFARWIYRDGLLTGQQMLSLLDTMLDDRHMFFHMGETKNDSVFTRAFSVLVLPLLLNAHRRMPYLTPQNIMTVKKELIRFLDEEQDRRGFVEGKGWAHAIAHAADALDELVLCEEMTRSDLLDMLNVVSRVVCDSQQVFTHGEEERLGTVLLSVIERHALPDEDICLWIESFSDPVLAVRQQPAKMYIRANAKNFLQSLYFRLSWKELLQPYEICLVQTLQSIAR